MRPSIYVLFFCISLALFSQREDRLATAEKLYMAGDYEKAFHHLSDLNKATRNSDFYLLEARLHEKLQRMANAQESYQKAIQLNVNHLEARFHYAAFLKQQMEWRLAISQYTYILDHLYLSDTQAIIYKNDPSGDSPTQVTTLASMISEVYLQMGMAHQAIKEYEKARMDFEKALSLNQSCDPWIAIALLEKELGKKTKAVEALNNAIVISPLSSVAWYNLLLVEPSTRIPAAIDKNTSFSPLLLHQAISAMNNDSLTQASQYLTNALEIDPENTDLIINAGRLDFKEQKYMDAILKYRKAHDLEPRKVEVLYLMANAYHKLKEYTQAQKLYSQYLLQDSTNGMVWFNLAMTYLELENEVESCRSLTRAKELGMEQAATYLLQYCSNN